MLLYALLYAASSLRVHGTPTTAYCTPKHPAPSDAICGDRSNLTNAGSNYSWRAPNIKTCIDSCFANLPYCDTVHYDPKSHECAFPEQPDDPGYDTHVERSERTAYVYQLSCFDCALPFCNTSSGNLLYNSNFDRALPQYDSIGVWLSIADTFYALPAYYIPGGNASVIRRPGSGYALSAKGGGTGPNNLDPEDVAKKPPYFSFAQYLPCAEPLGNYYRYSFDFYHTFSEKVVPNHASGFIFSGDYTFGYENVYFASFSMGDPRATNRGTIRATNGSTGRWTTYTGIVPAAGELPGPSSDLGRLRPTLRSNLPNKYTGPDPYYGTPDYETEPTEGHVAWDNIRVEYAGKSVEVADSSPNLVTNGNFEDGTFHPNPFDEYKIGRFINEVPVTLNVRSPGINSTLGLHWNTSASGQFPNEANLELISHQVNLKPGSLYRFRFDVRGLPRDFTTTLIPHAYDQNTGGTQTLLDSLEDPTNPERRIFAFLATNETMDIAIQAYQSAKRLVGQLIIFDNIEIREAYFRR